MDGVLDAPARLQENPTEMIPVPVGRERHLTERCKAIMRGENPGP